MARKYLQNVGVVDFYGRGILTGKDEDGKIYVPLKQIIEGHLGMDWGNFKQKMKRHIDGAGDRSLYSPKVVRYTRDSFEDFFMEQSEVGEDIIPHLEDAREYLEHLFVNRDSVEMVSLYVEELNLLLAQINALSIPDQERREIVLDYQKECGKALHDYWFHGFAVNGRENPSRMSAKRHEWCPREMATRSLEKACSRYSAFAQKHFESRVNPEEIRMHVINSIVDILDLEHERWDEQDGTLAFLLAFMERAAFDILYFSIEGNIPPEDLPDALSRNLENAWEHVGNLVISVQSPYTPFPGVGRGASRELV